MADARAPDAPLAMADAAGGMADARPIDAAAMIDAPATMVDAAAGIDAAPKPDAAASVDASPPVDAPPAVDAPPKPDAAPTPDAAPPDASTTGATGYTVTASSTMPIAGATITISAQLKGDSGPIAQAGRTVTWTSTSGGMFATATSMTNASGIATVAFTVSTLANSIHVVTATDGALTGKSANIVVVPGPVSPDQSYFTASPGSIPADGVSTSTIRIYLLDAFGNQLSKGGNYVVATTSLGSLGILLDNDDGSYRVILTSGTSPGVAAIHVSVEGDLISDGQNVVIFAP